MVAEHEQIVSARATVATVGSVVSREVVSGRVVGEVVKVGREVA